MAHISPIHHSASRRCRIQAGEAAWYYSVAAVRSALFAAALEFKMSSFPSLTLFFFVGEQTENSPPLSESMIALQSSPSVLYY